MSVGTTTDSPPRLTLHAPGLDAPVHTDAEAGHSAPARPKKLRRPRPTFDDGALTRTFKFPSKAYPRSSYYVTSDEIIIRIRKARRKWKLTVPKKRVVTYRTNRWFAKPRWVEIELTYTQAVKLGLEVARLRVPDPTQEIVSSNTASPTQSEVACPDAIGASPLVESGSIDPIEDLSEPVAIDDFELTADQDDADEDAEELLPLPEETRTDIHTEMISTDIAAMSQVDDGDENADPIVVQWTRPVSTPRRNIRPIMTMLVATVACMSIWPTLESATVEPVTECWRAEPTANCSSPIVTGSISSNSTPQTPEIPVWAPIESPPLPTAPAAPIERLDIDERSVTAAVSGAGGDAMPATTPLAETAQQAPSVILPPSGFDVPFPVVVSYALPAPRQPVTATQCAGLGDLGRRLMINFDYARDRLDPAVFSALDGFAAKLKVCPDQKVIIEGHTDSDGHADRNRKLSLGRAEAVQRHLVAAGADPEQLETIGFGETRPAAPNDSQRNKRSNRRAALVVTSR